MVDTYWVPYCGDILWLDIELDYLGWILFVLNLWGKTKDQMSNPRPIYKLVVV